MDKIKMLAQRLFLRSPNINIGFRIKISGNIEKKQFEAAMNNVCIRHPLLNSSIEIDDNHNAWFVPNTSHVGIEYYELKEMLDWQVWYNKEDDIPFDITHGPLIKICVIKDVSQMEIIILGHHVIGDGVGFLNLSKDILLALDNRMEIITQPLPIANNFQKGKKLGFLSKLYAKKLNSEWRKKPVRFSEEEYVSFFQQYRNKYISKIYMNSIDEINLKKIVNICKSHKMTVNELMTSAFSGAILTVLDFPKKKISIGMAANIRNELTVEPYYCMGNYVTGIALKVNYKPKNGFISNAENIASTMRKKLTTPRSRHLAVNFLSEFDGDLIESIMYASYGKCELPVSKLIGKLIGEGTDNKRLGMSNLGKYEFNNYETLQFLDIQFIGPTFPANLLSVNIITANNKLNFCLRYNENEIGSEIVEKIYEKAMELMYKN